MLDRSIEKRAQAGSDLLARHTCAEALVLDPKALPEVGQRVAGDNGTLALDPERDVVVLPAREDLGPRLAQLPLRVGCLPVPQAGCFLASIFPADSHPPFDPG